MKKNCKGLLLALVMLGAMVFNMSVFFGGCHDGAGDAPVSAEPDPLPMTEEELRQSLVSMNIGGGIQADGMSASRGSLPAVELGISECDVYCMDKYQIIPLCGSELTWVSSDEETAEVDGSGLVTTKKAGSVTITATDKAGNSDSCVINVIKVAYITIDDTPSKHTPRLLDILDEYGVKATFFMNADPGQKEQYVEIYKRGHTLAMHGYIHDTNYENPAEFQWNMEESRRFLMETTGCDSIDNLIRFPTGSKGKSNYRGILEYMQRAGYHAFDWTTEFHDYYYHTKEGCLEYFKYFLTHDRAVVLFHPLEWSVEALPEALDYLIEKGYTMATITSDTAQQNFYNFYID